MNKKYLVITGVVGASLLVLVGLWYTQDRLRGEQTPAGPVVTSAGGISVASAITRTDIPAPQVPRKITFPSHLDDEARKVVVNNIDVLAADIEKDPTNIDNWLDLALRYKVVEDFDGAREIWEYLTRAAPEHSVSFYNLGYHYHIDAKDYPKSEEYYKKAVEMDPMQEAYYTAFHELYRYSYKQDTSAAVDILKQGIKQLPNSINLRLALASYYRDDKKDKKSAIQYFTQARDLAKEQGNAQLVMSLDKEISALK